MNSQIVKDLVFRFKQTGQQLSLVSVMDVLETLMVFVENVEELTGMQKKQLVLAAIDKIIEESFPDDHPEYALLETSLKLIIPFAIDKLVYADQGGLGLHPKIVKKCNFLFGCC
jgi:hypothetical protein